MGDKSKIEWTDATWNPVTGCTPVSEGCVNCYAKRIARRFPHLHGTFNATAPWQLVQQPRGRFLFSEIQFHPDRLDQPLHWKAPRRIFVCSMGDLFHEDVLMDWVCENVLRVVDFNPKHTFMFLTKRPRRMRATMEYYYRDDKYSLFGPLDNLWLGVTAENQETADERIPILLQTPAEKRFVSVEPMLGPINLNKHILLKPEWKGGAFPSLSMMLDWVICGGESGPGARPMHPDWARSLRDQCQAAGVPFFFKQFGEWGPEKPGGYCRLSGKRYSHDSRSFLPDGTEYDSRKPDMYLDPKMATMYRAGKKAAGSLLDGREHKEFPEEAK